MSDLVDAPPTPAIMDPAAGEWVWANVLTKSYIASCTTPGGDRRAKLRRCPCQWGASGWCGDGRHLRCPRNTWDQHGKPAFETTVVDRRGGATAEVWRIGKPCRWLCRCVCHRDQAALIPPIRPTGNRRRSFGGNANLGGVADHLRIDDDPQPTLFEVAHDRP